MSTKPLTNQNAHVVVLAADLTAVNSALRFYGIPTDVGNVEPTLTVTKLYSGADVKTFIDTVPSPLLPWCILPGGIAPDEKANMQLRMQAYFGQRQTLASCLNMTNNEFAIKPEKLRG